MTLLMPRKFSFMKAGVVYTPDRLTMADCFAWGGFEPSCVFYSTGMVVELLLILPEEQMLDVEDLRQNVEAWGRKYTYKWTLLDSFFGINLIQEPPLF
ncbi:hypothetical protein HZ326_28320 [Fusarium oxysporum f. sp. albedinis]|nr:hypothetical protein HZ326_28320 [Fusarium oxysporum f. sp. albedinis]